MNFDVADGVAILERTPGTLRALLQGLPHVWTTPNEGPETWSPYDVVGHLIHGERCDWITRAQIIIAQGTDRRFVPFDRTAMFRESEGKSLDQMLDEFEIVRRQNLETLRSWKLGERELALEGEHPKFGAVTLRQLLATWVAHDLGHIVQITRVMAKQYKGAIGPWVEYLSVMHR